MGRAKRWSKSPPRARAWLVPVRVALIVCATVVILKRPWREGEV